MFDSIPTAPPPHDLDWPTYLRAQSIRIDRLEDRLEENTVATERVESNTAELVDILNSWKGAFKVLEFLGKVAKPVAAIGAVAAACFAWRTQK